MIRLRNLKTEFPVTIKRVSNERLNFQLIESLISLIIQILKLVLDPDVEWFTIEKGDGDD